MTSSVEEDGVTILRRLFDVVIRKAEADTQFAASLLAALDIKAQVVVVRKAEIQATSANTQREEVDPIGLLKADKEDFLRSRLSGLTSPQILQLARKQAYQIPNLSKMRKEQRIDAVIRFAKNRIESSEAYRA